MSALGQKRTLADVGFISALPPKADIGSVLSDVRFVPKADIRWQSGQLQRPSRESIAVRNFARVETVQEPTLALRRSTVGKGIWDYIALRFPLQSIVADG